ncbi:gag-pol polyprotein [Hordeum vulgare]|nr:gag-pol polyprotein [Hordeum vulgare]
MTTLQDRKHEDSATKISKPDELQDNAPKCDFTIIPLRGIDDAGSTRTLFEDNVATTMTIELNHQDLEASDMMTSKDDASIFGGKSDDVSSSAFIHTDTNEMVEHGIFPSTMTAYGDKLRDLCTHV